VNESLESLRRTQTLRRETISLDVQFLPDVTIDCPDCGGGMEFTHGREMRVDYIEME